MISFSGIGHLNELQVARPVKGARDLSASESAKQKEDGVTLSPESTQAAEVAGFIRDSKQAEEIRQERVDAAKESVEQGRHRVEEVVHAVAAALIGKI